MKNLKKWYVVKYLEDSDEYSVISRTKLKEETIETVQTQTEAETLKKTLEDKEK